MYLFLGILTIIHALVIFIADVYQGGAALGMLSSGVLLLIAHYEIKNTR